MEGLPLLPGFSCTDVTKTKHVIPHIFEWKNGYPLVKNAQIGVGDTPLDVDGVLYVRGLDSVRYDPSITYGRTKTFVPKVFKPHFVLYDKKCLSFKGFFKQGIPNSPDEHYRVRLVNFIYFLEDDTITVMEPPVENAGFPQGRLVTRGKIQKNQDQYYHWKDLNVGIDIQIYGIVYHLCSCDGYTREYLMSQGMEVRENEDLPVDPYIRNREAANSIKITSSKNCEDKMYKFLAFDKKVLRFFAVWDDRDSEYGSLNKYVILYHLGDDRMEIIEELKGNCGKEPYPVLLSRTKIPKRWKDVASNFPAIYLEKAEEDYNEYYSPKDLVVGNTLFIFGRRFLLYDCDQFTKTYYKTVFEIEQPNPIDVAEKTPEVPTYPLPKYTGFGSVEDSLQSWYSFLPKAPKMDLVRYLMNMSKKLRYTAVMDYIHPEDKDRRFILEYRLSDGCISIHELKVNNSGFEGGKFLTHTLVPKPNTSYDNPEYYTPMDFKLGAIINCFGHRFKITSVDLSVFRYMEANPEKFTPENIRDIRKHLVREGYLTEDVKDVADFRKREEIAEPIIEELPLKHPITAKDLIVKAEPPECIPLAQQQ